MVSMWRFASVASTPFPPFLRCGGQDDGLTDLGGDEANVQQQSWVFEMSLDFWQRERLME